MQGPLFDELFALLAALPLSGENLARLRAWIAGIHDPRECLALIEADAAGRPCPHCGAARVHRSGCASGLQRFRCPGCRRTFNALTGTLLARLRRRECWLRYLQCFLVAIQLKAPKSFMNANTAKKNSRARQLFAGHCGRSGAGSPPLS